MILGIDEVGRGPWAGPLVVGAVVLPDGCNIEGLTDSKKLTSKKRTLLEVQIKQSALGWGLGWVHPEELDSVGLSEALRLATIRAVEAVEVPYHEIVIDGTINFLNGTSKGDYVTVMPKADFLVPAVSAASIIAKVARDDYMVKQSSIYPDYGFDSNMGYGTAKHVSGLDSFGVTPIHRKSFKPIAERIVEPGLKNGASDSFSTTTSLKVDSSLIGSLGEDVAAKFLQDMGYQLIDRNWHNKWCEIDLILSRDSCLFFVEVKTRSSDKYGGPLDSITKTKLKQMHFAALNYLTANNLSHKDVKLAVASLLFDSKNKEYLMDFRVLAEGE